MKRRTLLAGVASTSLALSGCIRGLFREADVPLGYIELINQTDQDVDVAVTVDHDGETIIDEERTVTAANPDDPFEGRAGVYHDAFGEYDNYEVHVETLDGEFEVNAASAEVDGDALFERYPCFVFNIYIGVPSGEYDDMYYNRESLTQYHVFDENRDRIPANCIPEE